MDSGPGWIALSVSDPAEDELVARGLSATHLDLAFIEIARHLLATGCGLSYGGDLRLRGFTDQLFNLARSYHLPETPDPPSSDDPDAAKRVRNYLAAPLYDAAEATRLAAARNVADVRKVEILAEDMPSAVRGDHAAELALALSEMRRVVTEETVARVVVGGKLTGALGRAPGVLEEAWYSVQMERPLYVLGGFGGIGALIGDVLSGRDTSDREVAIAEDAGYVAMAGRLQGVLPKKTPLDGSAMLAEIAAGGTDGLQNGLTPAENQRLFDTDDIDDAISLLLRGLAAVRPPAR